MTTVRVTGPRTDGKRLMVMPFIQIRTCRQFAVYGHLALDISGEHAMVGGYEVILQQSDWAILARLAASDGAFVRGSDLLEEIWGDDMRDDPMFLRSWVRRLNNRLSSCCSGRPLIDTSPNGYRLLSPVEWNGQIQRSTGYRTTRTVSSAGSASPETYIPSSIPARK